MRHWWAVSLFLLFSVQAGFGEPASSALKVESPRSALAAQSSSLQLVNKGARLLSEGKSLEAETILGEAVVANENSPEAMYNFGLALSFNGKLGDAVHAFLKAIDLRKNYAEAHLAIGCVYLTAGDHQQALQAFDNAIALASDTQTVLSALHNRGLTLTKLSRFEEAKVCFFQIIGDDPEDMTAAFQLGKIFFLEKQYAQALTPLEIAMKDFPVEAGFLRCKALKALAKEEEAKESLKAVEEALERAELSSEVKALIRSDILKFRQESGF